MTLNDLVGTLGGLCIVVGSVWIGVAIVASDPAVVAVAIPAGLVASGSGLYAVSVWRRVR